MSQKTKAGENNVCIVFVLTYFQNTVSENGNLIRFSCFRNCLERFLEGALSCSAFPQILRKPKKPNLN